MWGEVLSENRKAIAAPLQLVAEALSDIARAVEANDADALERKINAAREALSGFSDERSSERHAPDEVHPAAKQR
jgi:prephenate dehydrogenase